MTIDIEDGPMATMPRLTLYAPGHADWADAPVPTLRGAGDAIVAPLAVATCDLDTAINRGSYPMRLPCALGHEFVARVEQVADGVTSVRPADIVAVPFQISCGSCAPCRRGSTGDCAGVPPLSMYGLGAMGGDWGGAMADLVRVPYADAMLVPLPAGIAPAAVASLDNLPDAWRTVAPYLADPTAPPDRRRVLVVGGLSIGLYAVAIARALGAEVSYVDSRPGQLAIAEGFGATVVEPDQARRLGPFPVTVSTNGTVEGLRLALRCTEPGGVSVAAGV
jgi:threonine dehydrogenase-like Zn-dependent dehydrogenase